MLLMEFLMGYGKFKKSLRGYLRCSSSRALDNLSEFLSIQYTALKGYLQANCMAQLFFIRSFHRN